MKWMCKRRSDMSREAAKKIIDLVVKQGAEQSAILAEVQSMCAEDEFRSYKQMIAQSMGSMLLDVITPLVELYPDLRPPELE
jgi:hypothetical protein